MTPEEPLDEPATPATPATPAQLQQIRNLATGLAPCYLVQALSIASYDVPAAERYLRWAIQRRWEPKKPEHQIGLRLL